MRLPYPTHRQLKGTARAGSQTSRGAIHEGTRVSALFGENPHYAYRRWLRLSRTTCTQVQRQAHHQAVEKECESVSGKSPKSGQGPSGNHCWSLDPAAQPSHSRMGTVSSACAEQINLSRCGHSHL